LGVGHDLVAKSAEGKSVAVADRENVLAVGAEHNKHDSILMASVGVQQLIGVGIPDAGSAVQRRGDEAAVVGAPGGSACEALVSVEHGQFLARVGLVNGWTAWAGRGEDAAAVRAEDGCEQVMSVLAILLIDCPRGQLLACRSVPGMEREGVDSETA